MIFQEIRTSNAKKPYIFVIFQVGGGGGGGGRGGGAESIPPFPPGSAHAIVMNDRKSVICCCTQEAKIAKGVDPELTASRFKRFACNLKTICCVSQNMRQTTLADETFRYFFPAANEWINPFPAIQDNCRLLSFLLIYFGGLYCK